MTNLLIVSAIGHRHLAANMTSGVYEGHADSNKVLIAEGVLLGLLVLCCICCTFVCCYWIDNEENKPYVVKEVDLEKGKEEPPQERKKKAGGNTVVMNAPETPRKKKEDSDSRRPYPLSKEKTFETKPSIKMYQGSQNFDNYIIQIGGADSYDANDSPRAPVDTTTEMIQYNYNDKDIAKYAERHLKPNKLQHQQSYFSRYGFESMNYAETGSSFRMPGGSSWYDKSGGAGGAGGGVEGGTSGKVKMTTGNYYMTKHHGSNSPNNVSLQSSSTSSVSMGSSSNTLQ